MQAGDRLSLGAWPVVVANAITLALTILGMKLRFGRVPRA